MSPEHHVSTPGQLREAIPQLLGFTPENSMVIIGTEPPDNKVVVTLRYDLPDPAMADISSDIAGHAESVLLGVNVSTAIAAGYGPDQLVAPIIEALRATSLEISVVSGNPPEGPAPVPVLTTRASLAASVAPVTGGQSENMRQLTRRELALAGGHRGASYIRLGLSTVQQLIARYREDNEAAITDAEAATVTVALAHLRVRDDAWSRLDPAHKEAHQRLMTGLTRLAAPGYVAAPASLLAFTAWQNGDGALANVALDRALADDPRYSMARLLEQAIMSGAPPSMARLPMSPEEVAASYDEMEQDAAR
jgi:hypothetical protein